MLGCFTDKRVLLLQGPMGPFFRRLGGALRRRGATVYKINFCGGDELFYPVGATRFRGDAAQWPVFLDEFVDTHRIDTIMLFGDCRAHHVQAAALARSRGLRLYVFEEGYLRPDFVTVELGGANSYSSLPQDPEVYRRFSAHPSTRRRPKRVRHAFGWAALYASLYAAATFVMKSRFPCYRHHRSLDPRREFRVWSRSALRKVVYRWKERRVLRRLTAPGAPGFYLVPLQVHGDSQISVHSHFHSVPDFIEAVLRSFAAHAPAGRLLVIKHHPLDRGYHDYAALIGRLCAEHGLLERVLYVHDPHLPTLLDRALGTVVINSTVGLSSVHHGTPVHVLGNAIYRIPGLAHQGTLDAFWSEPGKPDAALYRSFRAWLCAYNQANGNFYAPLPGCDHDAGLRWPALFPAPSSGSFEETPESTSLPRTVSV